MIRPSRHGSHRESMYTQYYGLKEKPFTIPPNPRYLYMSELHREALAHLLYGIDSDGCFILLTGEIGTGKTTVCRCLLEQLPETTDIAYILNPKLSIIDLMETICEELGIQVEERKDSIKHYIDALNRYLLQAHANGRNTALIIDEAQNLDIDILEQLRLLTNLETNTQKLLRIVLIGQTELKDILNQPELTQLKQRITSRYHLKPLNTGDVKTYIQHRISIAGGGRAHLFTDPSIKYIAQASNGVPRLINLLCDRALLGAYAESYDQVDLKIAKKAGKEVFFNEETKPANFFKKPVYVLLLLLLLLFGGYFMSENSTDYKTLTGNISKVFSRTDAAATNEIRE